jgi:hypothetical protein
MTKKIIFKNKEFPIRKLKVLFNGSERIYTIAAESLSDAMGEEKDDDASEASELDSTIYFYLADELIHVSADEICKKHLDIEMQFIEEL